MLANRKFCDLFTPALKKIFKIYDFIIDYLSKEIEKQEKEIENLKIENKKLEEKKEYFKKKYEWANHDVGLDMMDDLNKNNRIIK